MSTLAALFGVLALLLAAIGLYGTLSQVVLQRTSEIGIRLALGASRSGVTWMVLRRSLLVAAAGLIAGIPAALFAARPVRTLLYGLEPNDTATIVMGAAVLLAVAFLASYLPARRAARIDPIIALRYE